MMLEKKKDVRKTFISLVAVALFLALVLVLDQVIKPSNKMYMLLTVLQKGSVYALAAVSMSLLNGFTGLFSLGHAGFMLIGAYTYAIFSIPAASRDTVYQYYDAAIRISFPEVLGNALGGFGTVLGVIICVLLAGLMASLFAYLIGLPVLRLKSDYLAIATLGFAEIIRAIFQWGKLGPVTNGSNLLKSFTRISNFKIGTFSMSTFVPVLIATVSIILIVMLVNSTYGRAFKAIRDDEVAAEAMGINLAKHKMLSFVTSSFFAGVGGALFAMYVANAQAKVFTATMTYEILLIVVIGGIGSISGSCIATFLYVACSEWWMRFLDTETYIGTFKVPLLHSGFRMVVFSVVIMVVVLFFRKGIMGDRELPQVIAGWKEKSRAKKAAKQEVTSK